MASFIRRILNIYLICYVIHYHYTHKIAPPSSRLQDSFYRNPFLMKSNFKFFSWNLDIMVIKKTFKLRYRKVYYYFRFSYILILQSSCPFYMNVRWNLTTRLNRGYKNFCFTLFHFFVIILHISDEFLPIRSVTLHCHSFLFKKNHVTYYNYVTK